MVTTTWIGVLVLTYFNRRLGWPLSGLVVPGYLVPLIIIKPWSAAVIGVESVLTYLAVWVLSEICSRRGLWPSLFGRDRFFALVLMSTLVRVVLDGWLLPQVGAWAVQEYGLVFDYRNNLHSFGLIIVALLANQFWKTGLWRGLPPVVVNLALTWVLVRFGLMLLTNFRISDIGYLYEDIASSILASPKAYIILIVTAFLASRMNLKYGWEFNGILIPSLIALQWYEPLKIVTSVAEAFVILGIGVAVLKLPFFANRNVEGGAKIAFFYTICFVYKLALGHLLPFVAPAVKVSDYFGFGYLLSTLIAIKIHDKGIPILLARATVQTSLTGVAIASVIGFGLTLLPGIFPSSVADFTEAPAEAVREIPASLDAAVAEQQIALYAMGRNATPPVVTFPEQQAFISAIEAIADLGPSVPEALPMQIASRLSAIGFSAFIVEGRYAVVADTVPERGWGTYIRDLTRQSGLVVEVPEPLERRGLVAAALSVFQEQGGHWFALSGVSGRMLANPEDGSLRNRQSLYSLFHNRISQDDVLQVRGQTAVRLAELGRGERRTQSLAGEALPTLLWIKRSLPSGVHLTALQDVLGQIEVLWGAAPFENVLRDQSYGGFAELHLGDEAIRRLVRRGLMAQLGGQAGQDAALEVIKGPVRARMGAAKERILPPGSEAYQPPSLAELLYIDEEVLTPLLALLPRPESAERNDGLREIGAAARAVGLSLERLEDVAGARFILLAERSDRQRDRGWGTFVFREGQSTPYLLQVPHPMLEANSLEYALNLFSRANARSLSLAGAHAWANRDASSDLVAPQNLNSLFTLVSQVTLRESEGQPVMAVQIRGQGADDSPEADGREDPQRALIALLSGHSVGTGLGPLASGLVDIVKGGGLEAAVADGRKDSALSGAVDMAAQARYLPFTQTGEFAQIWLPVSVRLAFRESAERLAFQAPFEALGIKTVRVDPAEWLVGHSRRPFSGAAAIQFLGPMTDYMAGGDVMDLWAALTGAGKALGLVRLADPRTGDGFLALSDPEGGVLALANLAPLKARAVSLSSPESSLSTDSIHRFAAAKTGWLLFASELPDGLVGDWEVLP